MITHLRFVYIYMDARVGISFFIICDAKGMSSANLVANMLQKAQTRSRLKVHCFFVDAIPIQKDLSPEVFFE